MDTITHAGDLITLRVLDELERTAPVFSVHDNMDNIETRKKLPKIRTLEVFNWRIGVTHNLGFLRNNIRKITEEKNLDVMIFGHTHRTSIQWEENILFINPRSPTNPIPPFFTKPKIATLKITRDKIVPLIITLDN